MNKSDSKLHLSHYLRSNAESFPNKIWLKDDDFAANWLETVIATERIVAFLEATIPLQNQENKPRGIVVRGDCGALHVLALIAILVSDFVYIPENRTLRRDSETNVLSEYPLLAVDKDSITVVDNSITRINKILTKKGLFDDANIRDVKPKKFMSSSPQNLPSAFFYTSGSTGTPKIIVIPHSNLIRGAQFVSEALGITSNDIIAGTLTLDFDYGVNQVLNTVISCATYVCCPFSSPRTFWTNIARLENCTMIPTMPFLIEKYFISTVGLQLPKVRLVTSSGGPFLDQHIEQVKKLCPETNISPMYGLSEGFRATILPEELFSAHPTSVGFPIGDTEIQIRDSGFHPLSNNCEGEIWQASGCVSWGYFCDVASTREKFILDETYPNKIWIRSGDLGYLDENGLLYIVGRITHQIKRFGIRISINEVERAYMDLPGVDQCVVIPLPKNATESDIGVIVVGKNLTSELLTRLGTQIPVELRASKIRIADSIPGNYNEGKPDRERLLKEYFQA
jgi:acyl-CoA synthetase (AMP-forming)/AMP-acid ligase II